MESQIKLICGDSGERIDVWLAGKIDGVTRSGVQKLITGGSVTVNGTRPAKNYIVKSGDRITFEPPPPEPSGVAGQPITLNIVYEDDYIIAVDKPRGMVVHPGSGNRDGTLANALAFHCSGSLSDAGGAARPGIVHRLDKDTSGLIVAAKTNEAHYKLAAEFKERRVIKIYNAIVYGNVEQSPGRIEMPIGRHRTDRQRMAVAAEGGREAVTLFKAIMRLPCGCTWLELEIPTGRTHQIRVHLAEIGFPVVGDPVYGRPKSRVKCAGRDICHLKFRAATASVPTLPECPLLSPCNAQLLHSTRIEFTHPITGEHMKLSCDLPPYFPVPERVY